MRFIAAIALCVLCVFAQERQCGASYPRHYVVYKLQPGEKITIDGRLDEPVWKNTPDIGALHDISGEGFPEPYLNTVTYARYDDEYLYVGGYLEEPQAYCDVFVENMDVYTTNDFEVFVDPGGTAQMYKENEIDAANIRFLLLMVRPYVDGGVNVCKSPSPDMCSYNSPENGVYDTWDILNSTKTAVYINGTLNDPEVGSKYWTFEMALRIDEMLMYNDRSNQGGLPLNVYGKTVSEGVVSHGDIWLANFMRVQFPLNVATDANGKKYYEEAGKCDNWAWQPTNIVNIHLPERWGYIQFSDETVGSTKIVSDPAFEVRRALAQIYYAQGDYIDAMGTYTTNLQDLVDVAGLPADILTGNCVSVPQITVSQGNNGKPVFTATATSSDGTVHGSVNQIRQFAFKQVQH